MSYQSLPSTYYDGTATVAAGGTTVTGQGTLWKNAIYPGDFFGVHLGLAIRVLDVVSDTQLTLAKPWPGAAQTTAAYEIMLTPDLSRVRETTRKLLEELGNGTLTSIAQMAGANGQMLMFTGAGAMSTFQSGQAGRDVLAASTIDAAALAGGFVSMRNGVNFSTTVRTRIGWHNPGGYLIAQADNLELGAVWTDNYITATAAARRTALGAQAALGYTPVQQGGGTGMGTHKIYVGWDDVSGGGLLAQVNSTTMGYLWSDNRAAINPADMRSKISAFSTSGGTITGSVNVTGNVTSGNGVFTPFVYNIGAANTDGAIYFQTGVINGAVSNRWAWVRAGFGVGEPGNNVGSDMKLMRWSDANAYLGTSIEVNRRHGNIVFPDTIFALAVPNYGNLVLNTGQQLGAIGDTGGLTFNRGQAGFAVSIGGNPGAGGRAIHVNLTGWYRFSCGATFYGAGAVMSVARNGVPMVNLYGNATSWISASKSFVLPLTAGDFLSWYASSNDLSFSGGQSYIQLEYINP